jgi:hypothetical protein
MPPRL